MTRDDPLLLRALRREPTERPPVWLMRQAGRYLPEYQEVRRQAGGFLEMVHDPALAAEVTLQPVRRFGVDAAILFSDILLPLAAMGLPLSFEDGRGPIFPEPLRDAAGIDALTVVDPAESLGYVGEALERVRAELPESVTLLGFCGAPFTLACYAVEGGHSKSHANVRKLMYREPRLFARLMEKLAAMSGAHLRYQVEQGAQAVVLFDTWAGTLSREDYRERVRPWTEQALAPVAGLAPRMAFVLDGGHLLDLVVETGVEAVAIDWRTPLGATLTRHGDQVAVQGNLDPAVLLAAPDEVERRTRLLLEEAGGRPGHVMSLGHGVLKETDPECVAAFVRCVKEREATSHA